MVLALPFASHYLQGTDRPKVKDYFRRRLIRIEVPYIITLTFFLFYAVTFQDRLWNEMLPRYFAGLIYSHSLIYDGELNPSSGFRGRSKLKFNSTSSPPCFAPSLKYQTPSCEEASYYSQSSSLSPVSMPPTQPSPR